MENSLAVHHMEEGRSRTYSVDDKIDLSEEAFYEMEVAPIKVWERPKDEELRILIFTACYFVLDGVTLTIRRLESHLKSRGAIVKIATCVPDDFSEEQKKEVIVLPGIKIPFTQAGEGYAFGSTLKPESIRLIEEFNPNCVHFTVPDLVSLDAIRWCQRNNIAYMATFHSNYSDYLKYYYMEWALKSLFLVYLRGFYEQIPALYVPTRYMVDKLKAEGFGVNTQLVEWGRGVDLKLFSPDRRSNEFRASRGVGRNDIMVLWVGRLVPEKRPDIYTAVLQRLHAEGLPVKGVVVGHGTFENTFASMPYVSCAGWLSGVALAEAYASADVLLFPSGVETFGNVTLEAIASGLPGVVVTECSGHLVQSGYNGFTCPDDDLEGFYQTTRSLVVDKQLRKRMSRDARRSAWKFERGKILQQMAENYKDAILRHKEPQFMKNLSLTNHGQGNTVLSRLCCNFAVFKWIVDPLFAAFGKIQDIAEFFKNVSTGSASPMSCFNSCGTCNRCSSSCMKVKSSQPSHSSLTSPSQSSRMTSSPAFTLLLKTMNYTAIIASYVIIGLLIYASFIL